MKNLFKILILFVLFSNLFSVSNNSTNFELLEEREGQYYLKNSGKLFSGLVYNIDGRSDGNIRNGKKSGKFIFYYDNGQIKKEGYYQNNFQQRRWKYYYESGQLKGTGSYINGNGSELGVDSGIPQHGRIGNWVFYYENGGLKAEQNWKNGRGVGYYRTYYDNGQIEWESYDKNDGTRDESKPTTKWYKNGHLWFTGYWIDDIGWEGFYKEYYENGQLKITLNYNSGKVVGVHKSYYDNGQIEWEYYYNKDGTRDGSKSTSRWYKNGQLWYTGYVVTIDGIPKWNGLKKIYNEEGDLIEEETYKDGKLINYIEY